MAGIRQRLFESTRVNNKQGFAMAMPNHKWCAQKADLGGADAFGCKFMRLLCSK
jgi:hypothetical protein